MKRRSQDDERGNSIVEFALVATLLIPLFFGMVAVGINTGTMVQAVQVSRDIGHMYARGVDFSQTANQNIAVQLATGTGMTTSGGNAVIILSQITQVYQADCTAAGASSCSNLGKTVFINRLVIGNSSLLTSPFGTPAASIVNSSGNIAASDYVQNSTAVATGFAAVLSTAGITPSDGDVIYLDETYFSTPALSFLPNTAAQGVYARSIF